MHDNVIIQAQVSMVMVWELLATPQVFRLLQWDLQIQCLSIQLKLRGQTLRIKRTVSPRNVPIILISHCKPSFVNLYHQNIQEYLWDKSCGVFLLMWNHYVNPNCKQSNNERLHHPTCDVASMTVVRKLDAFTEKLVNENIQLKEENEVLKEQIVALQEKCSRADASSVSIASTSPESVASSFGGDIQHHSTGESPSVQSTTTLTTEEISNFNKLPKNLKQFYEQMETGKYSFEMYSKCSSTKSVFTKRKRVLSTCKTILVDLINILKISKESPQHGYTIMLCEARDLD